MPTDFSCDVEEQDDDVWRRKEKDGEEGGVSEVKSISPLTSEKEKKISHLLSRTAGWPLVAQALKSELVLLAKKERGEGEEMMSE